MSVGSHHHVYRVGEWLYASYLSVAASLAEKPFLVAMILLVNRVAKSNVLCHLKFVIILRGKWF